MDAINAVLLMAFNIIGVTPATLLYVLLNSEQGTALRNSATQYLNAVAALSPDPLPAFIAEVQAIIGQVAAQPQS
jgi:hypothetical protein